MNNTINNGLTLKIFIFLNYFHIFSFLINEGESSLKPFSYNAFLIFKYFSRPIGFYFLFLGWNLFNTEMICILVFNFLTLLTYIIITFNLIKDAKKLV